MAYEFKRLSEVPDAEEVQDTDSVLIVQNDEVKKTAKENVIPSGQGGIELGTVYFTLSGGSLRTGIDWDTGSDASTEDVVTAYKENIVKIFYMYDGSLSGVGNVVGYTMYNGSEFPIWARPDTCEIDAL